MNGGVCDICGQPLTDASGRWDFTGRDRGINAIPGLAGEMRFRCCAWCKEGLDKAIDKLSEEHKEERKHWVFF